MLATGKSLIRFASISEDVKNVLKIASQLCSKAEIIGKSIVIEGGIIKKRATINVGESGLGLRMLTPILSAVGGAYEISGKGSLLNRPTDFIIESLERAGAVLTTTNGKLPILIKKGITKNHFEVDASLSSQLLTGLLMAAPLINKDVCIEVANLNSKPYIDLTINILKDYNIEVINENYKRFTIKSGQRYLPVNLRTEGDWSSVAFALVAAATTGELQITDIDKYSKQGDKKIVEILKKAGAFVEWSDNDIIVKKGNLNCFQFDATDTPDLFPPLVALAVHCKGVSRIKGVSRLQYKESNRAYTLQKEFQKLSAKIKLEGDYMLIEGSNLKGNIVSSHNDHRIAMALAVAALNIEESVRITNSEAVNKSWVEFFDVLEELTVDS